MLVYVTISNSIAQHKLFTEEVEGDNVYIDRYEHNKELHGIEILNASRVQTYGKDVVVSIDKEVDNSTVSVNHIDNITTLSNQSGIYAIRINNFDSFIVEENTVHEN